LDEIDGPGLEFLSDLRGHGIPARTILTDTSPQPSAAAATA
jgi:hypothetical protein